METKPESSELSVTPRAADDTLAVDLETVLVFIRDNPGTRSGEIRASLGFTMTYTTRMLLMLRRSGRVRLLGLKKAATYTVI